MASREFLYVADPMCSWCYGFAPVIEGIARHFEGRVPVRMIMGGLRAGNTRAMRPEDKDYIRAAWTKVGKASGQPFDFAFFDRATFTYDTEPACRAVVTVRGMAPAKALAFKGRLSHAFYGRNRDITDADEIVKIAEEADLDGDEFRARFMSADVRNETFRDFLIAKEMGVEGFPCLLIGSAADGYALITQGFRPIDGICEAVEGWMAKTESTA
jgi:putative protein-disulfide isomerase